jgi:hypothetical protein
MGRHEQFKKWIEERKIMSDNKEDNKSKEHRHDSGLTRSHRAAGFHQIPLEALQCLADRFTLGKKQRSGGTDWCSNKQKSLKDDDFYLFTLNHAQEHLSKLMNGDFSEDNEWGHLGAIMFMCAVRAWRLKALERYDYVGRGKVTADTNRQVNKTNKADL